MAYVGKITGTNGTTGLVGSTLYGTCATAASTVAKVVTLAEFDKLMTGVTIHVKFTYSNTSANPTLNVNSTGAKSICRNGTTKVGNTEGTSWVAGAVLSFTYDGTNWVMNDSCSFPLAHTHPDQDIKWGTGATNNTQYEPISALFNPYCNTNRFSCLDGNGVTIETSTNGGQTWTTNTSRTATQKSNHYTVDPMMSTNLSQPCVIGFPDKTTNARIRITIDTVDAKVGRINIRKIFMYCGGMSNSVSKASVTIKAATHDAPTNFSKIFCENVKLYGSSNIISNSEGIMTYNDDGTGTYQKIQFIFTRTVADDVVVSIYCTHCYGEFLAKNTERNGSYNTFFQDCTLPYSPTTDARIIFNHADVYQFNRPVFIPSDRFIIANSAPDIWFGTPETIPNGSPNRLRAQQSLQGYEWVLPPASGTLCISDGTGSATQPVYISGNKTKAVTQPASGAWFSAVPKIDSSGVLEIGRYIDFHATSASTNNYDIRLDASSTSLITLSGISGNAIMRIAGTEPMIRFQQTTSGKAYDGARIWTRPADTAGSQLFIQSGGITMIGSGEFCTNAVSRKDANNQTVVGFDNIVTTNATTEKLYIGSDKDVQIIANGQNIGTYNNNDHKVWHFETTGQLLTPGEIKDSLSSQHTMIEQSVRSSGNSVVLAKWVVDGAASATHLPQISFYNMGGDATDKGAITLLPYHSNNTTPWGGNIGLYIGKNILKLDGKNVLHTGNTSASTTPVSGASTIKSIKINSTNYNIIGAPVQLYNDAPPTSGQWNITNSAFNWSNFKYIMLRVYKNDGTTTGVPQEQDSSLISYAWLLNQGSNFQLRPSVLKAFNSTICAFSFSSTGFKATMTSGSWNTTWLLEVWGVM